jgi:hypothetical protein
VLAFRESLAVALQVSPVLSAREVLLLWGVRWAPGDLRAAVDERAGIERAGGAGGASRDSNVLAQVRVLQFSPTAVFNDADNDALLTLCLGDMPRLQALCLKGATGVAVATVQRLVAEHKALRFVCVVGAKKPNIGREVAAMEGRGVALTDKTIAVPLGAIATSDARERAKRAAYDWLMASAARRYSTSLPQLASPPLPQVVFRPFARPVVTLTDVEHRFSLDAGARRSFLDRVLAFIESGASDSDFPLPINIGNASHRCTFQRTREEEVCGVPHAAAGQSRQLR